MIKQRTISGLINITSDNIKNFEDIESKKYYYTTSNNNKIDLEDYFIKTEDKTNIINPIDTPADYDDVASVKAIKDYVSTRVGTNYITNEYYSKTINNKNEILNNDHYIYNKIIKNNNFNNNYINNENLELYIKKIINNNIKHLNNNIINNDNYYIKNNKNYFDVYLKKFINNNDYNDYYNLTKHIYNNKFFRSYILNEIQNYNINKFISNVYKQCYINNIYYNNDLHSNINKFITNNYKQNFINNVLYNNDLHSNINKFITNNYKQNFINNVLYNNDLNSNINKFITNNYKQNFINNVNYNNYTNSNINKTYLYNQKKLYVYDLNNHDHFYYKKFKGGRINNPLEIYSNDFLALELKRKTTAGGVGVSFINSNNSEFKIGETFNNNFFISKTDNNNNDIVIFQIDNNGIITNSNIQTIENNFNNYYTQTQINNLLINYYTQTDINSILNTGYYTKTAVNNLILDQDNYIKSYISAAYYTKTESDSKYLLNTDDFFNGVLKFNLYNVSNKNYYHEINKFYYVVSSGVFSNAMTFRNSDGINNNVYFDLEHIRNTNTSTNTYNINFYENINFNYKDLNNIGKINFYIPSYNCELSTTSDSLNIGGSIQSINFITTNSTIASFNDNLDLITLNKNVNINGNIYSSNNHQILTDDTNYIDLCGNNGVRIYDGQGRNNLISTFEWNSSKAHNVINFNSKVFISNYNYLYFDATDALIEYRGRIRYASDGYLRCIGYNGVKFGFGGGGVGDGTDLAYFNSEGLKIINHSVFHGYEANRTTSSSGGGCGCKFTNGASVSVYNGLAGGTAPQYWFVQISTESVPIASVLNNKKMYVPAGYSPFTGSHEIEQLDDYDEKHIGKLVCSKNCQIKDFDNINVEAQICNHYKCKLIYGILRSKYITNNDAIDGNGDDIIKFSLNGVGEGSIIVSNKNGNIEAGDYLVSDGEGFACKQEDDIYRSYTVAKAFEFVNFEQENITTKLISCIYLCS